jgi:hypothetical protein
LELILLASIGNHFSFKPLERFYAKGFIQFVF